MKKLSLYIFLGLLWCNVGFADWKKITVNEAGSTMYFDPNTLKKHNGYYYVWTMTDYLKKDSVGNYSNKIHMQIDCISKKYKSLTFVFYKEQMVKGEESVTFEGDDVWDSFAPNSVGEDFINSICK